MGSHWNQKKPQEILKADRDRLAGRAMELILDLGPALSSWGWAKT